MAAPGKRAKALYGCVGESPDELTFNADDLIVEGAAPVVAVAEVVATQTLTCRAVRLYCARTNSVAPTEDADWYEGTLERTGKRGIFPGNFVEFLQPEKPKVGQKPYPVVRPTRVLFCNRLV